MSKIILTGDRPTGRLHLGHYVGSLRRRVELQNSGLYDKIFIMIADSQAPTDNADNHEKVRQWRRKQALRRTRARRPDMYAKLDLSSKQDKKLLKEMEEEDRVESGYSETVDL